MELTRIIHPIGQGGFYTETLKEGDEEVNVVYDCGGFFDKISKYKQSKTDMEVYLKNNIINKVIDAVFISHFDWDHINGLEFLLNNYTVKYIFLPQMTEEIRYAILVYYIGILKIKNINILVFIEHLLLGIIDNNKTKIIWVESAGNQVYRHQYSIKNITLNNGAILPAGSEIHFNNKWVYIPYNPPVSTKNGKSVKQCFEDKFGNKYKEVKLQELHDFLKDKVDECKDIYKDCFEKKQNLCSMTLFSGCINSKFFYLGTDCFKFNDNPNCMYMGDFYGGEIYVNNNKIDNLNLLTAYYGKYWEKTAVIQVPHHGSNDNNFEKSYEYANMGFISVGRENQYKHPGNETMITMEENRCQSLIVTESPSSKKIFHYLDDTVSDEEKKKSKRSKKSKDNEDISDAQETQAVQKSLQEPMVKTESK